MEKEKSEEGEKEINKQIICIFFQIIVTLAEDADSISVSSVECAGKQCNMREIELPHSQAPLL